MEKRNRFLCMCIGIIMIVLLSSCSDSVNENSESKQEKDAKINEVDVSYDNANTQNGGQVVWENSTLDVDGNGLNDYATIEILKKDDVYWNVVTVVLDDGTRRQIEYLGRTEFREDVIAVQIGRLHFSEKDSIVIEITVPTSNYGSTDIHVLSMFEGNQGKDLVEELTILDGMTNSPQYDLFRESAFVLEDSLITITGEAELVHFESELGKNVIQVSECENEATMLIYYENGIWKAY